MKERFKDQQTKSRRKRREMMKSYQDEEFAKLSKEVRQRKLDKQQKRKEQLTIREE